MEVEPPIKIHFWHLQINRRPGEHRQASVDLWCEKIRVGLEHISKWLEEQNIPYNVEVDGMGINMMYIYGDISLTFTCKKNAILFKLKWVDQELPYFIKD
jgi:hypothetical protein